MTERTDDVGFETTGHLILLPLEPGVLAEGRYRHDRDIFPESHLIPSEIVQVLFCWRVIRALLKEGKEFK
jgi:hypothetical protein